MYDIDPELRKKIVQLHVHEGGTAIDRSTYTASQSRHRKQCLRLRQRRSYAFPRRKAASKRVSTPAGAGKDFPCRVVKGCPVCGQRTVP